MWVPIPCGLVHPRFLCAFCIPVVFTGASQMILREKGAVFDFAFFLFALPPAGAILPVILAIQSSIGPIPCIGT